MANIKFTKSHEWVKIENNSAVIGITEYAQKELGDVVFIELPKTGTLIKRALSFGTIESTKAASELYAPVSGEVIAVNNELVNNPQWVNESPLDKGWMVKVKISNAGELNSLMDEKEYKEFVKGEKHA